jgi:hypothetical protein
MKKILLVVAILTVLVIGLVGYWMWSTSGLSPKQVAVYEDASTELQISYGSPQMRGRTILGAAADKPVLTWGEYWRLGANEATHLSTAVPLQIGQTVLEPGHYSMYAFPHPTHMTVVFNAEYNRWGYSAPDQAKDVLRFDAPVAQADSTAEGFVIAFEQGPLGSEIRFQWGDYLTVMPIQLLATKTSTNE